jgi:hypothetical protein
MKYTVEFNFLPVEIEAKTLDNAKGRATDISYKKYRMVVRDENGIIRASKEISIKKNGDWKSWNY